MSKTAAARGSQSATEPMMVEAEVAEKKPKRMESEDERSRRCLVSRNFSMSGFKSVDK